MTNEASLAEKDRVLHWLGEDPSAFESAIAFLRCFAQLNADLIAAERLLHDLGMNVLPWQRDVIATLGRTSGQFAAVLAQFTKIKEWASHGRRGRPPKYIQAAPAVAALRTLLADIAAALATYFDEVGADAEAMDCATAALLAGRARVDDCNRAVLEESNDPSLAKTSTL